MTMDRLTKKEIEVLSLIAKTGETKEEILLESIRLHPVDVGAVVASLVEKGLVIEISFNYYDGGVYTITPKGRAAL